jgi:hypothetical protein
MCQGAVNWTSSSQAAKLFNVTPARIRQLIDAGRLPGTIYYRASGIAPFHKIPLDSLALLLAERQGRTPR